MKPRHTALIAALITTIVAFLEKRGIHATSVQLTAAAGSILTMVHAGSTPSVQHKARKVVSRKARLHDTLGLWVWNLSDPHTVVNQAKRYHYGWVAVKVHDGELAYNNPTDIIQLHTLCKKAGIRFGVWGYNRDFSDAEAARASIKKYKADFYIADIEVEFEKAPRNWSSLFVKLMEKPCDLWLSSFGRVDLHPDIDYRAFSSAGWGFMPQAYECESIELSPIACRNAALRYFHPKDIQPTLGAYAGALFDPTGDELHASCPQGMFTGVNVWDSQTASPSQLAGVAKIM